jgi:hypothetical protein
MVDEGTGMLAICCRTLSATKQYTAGAAVQAVVLIALNILPLTIMGDYET